MLSLGGSERSESDRERLRSCCRRLRNLRLRTPQISIEKQQDVPLVFLTRKAEQILVLRAVYNPQLFWLGSRRKDCARLFNSGVFIFFTGDEELWGVDAAHSGDWRRSALLIPSLGFSCQLNNGVSALPSLPNLLTRRSSIA